MPSYPYTSGQAALIQAINQLRTGFPATVDAGYLQRFSIARANESYVINIVRFLGIIDEDGKPVDGKTDYFYKGDADFKQGFENAIRDAYPQLFDEMGDSALEADRDKLTSWFRAADKTTDLVGKRQAGTFQTLAALAGHGTIPAARATTAKKDAAPTPKPAKKTAAAAKKAPVVQTSPTPDGGSPERVTADVGLTVRIEVNLPAGGDAATYDAIFASIAKHLIP